MYRKRGSCPRLQEVLNKIQGIPPERFVPKYSNADAKAANKVLMNLVRYSSTATSSIREMPEVYTI